MIPVTTRIVTVLDLNEEIIKTQDKLIKIYQRDEERYKRIISLQEAMIASQKEQIRVLNWLGFRNLPTRLF